MNVKKCVTYVMVIALLLLAGCQFTSGQELPEEKQPFTEADMLDFPLLCYGVSRAEMEASMADRGLQMEVEDAGYVTHFFNDDICYTYDGWYTDESSPKSVWVSGTPEVPGPRGIQVGDSFQSVLDRFPNETYWRDNDAGVFYGDAGPADEMILERTEYFGLVHEALDGEVYISFGWPDAGSVTEGSFQIILRDGVVVEFGCILFELKC